MRNIVLVRNFHPNEEVAFTMAGLVRDKLSNDGMRAKLIELEADRRTLMGRQISWAMDFNRNPMHRFELLNMVVRAHPGNSIFDFHDSDIKDLREFGFDSEPFNIQEDEAHGYSTIEVPAVYIRQTDPEVYGYGKEWDLKTAKYFEARSDWQSTREGGLCTSETVYLLSQAIIQLAES